MQGFRQTRERHGSAGERRFCDHVRADVIGNIRGVLGAGQSAGGRNDLRYSERRPGPDGVTLAPLVKPLDNFSVD